jgi:hypothetical protein
MYGSGQPYKCMVSTWLQGYTSGRVLQYHTAEAQQEESGTAKLKHRKCNIAVSTWLQGYTSGGVVQFYTAQAQQEGSSTDKAQHRKRNVAQAQQEESGTAK